MAEVVAKDSFALVMEEGGGVVSLSSDEHQPKQQGDVVTSKSHDGVFEKFERWDLFMHEFYPKFLNWLPGREIENWRLQLVLLDFGFFDGWEISLLVMWSYGRCYQFVVWSILGQMGEILGSFAVYVFWVVNRNTSCLEEMILANQYSLQ